MKGYNLRDKLGSLVGDSDFIDYLTTNAKVPLTLTLKPQVKAGSKDAIYNYYHGVILVVAIEALTEAGYEMMDKVKADYILKSHCATSTMIRNGEEEPFLEDKSKMTKKRLVKYVTDCIFLLENELGVAKVPDSESYRNMQETGYAFKSLKSSRKFN